MRPDVRISVVTPSLNQGRYLERTIRSVLDQGYPNLEYIVIDGGSEDASTEILRRYDSRIDYWVSEPDRGQSHAINKGLARATGDVIAYLNSDDFYLPGALAEVGRRFSDPEVLWLAGGCRYEHDDGSIETVLLPQRPTGSRAAWLRELWYAPQASSFWRREIFERHGGVREDLSFVFDTEFGLRLALAGVLPHVTDEILAVRFLHDEAKSATKHRFDEEWSRVAPLLRAQLTLGDHVADLAGRVAFKLRRAVRRDRRS